MRKLDPRKRDEHRLARALGETRARESTRISGTLTLLNSKTRQPGLHNYITAPGKVRDLVGEASRQMMKPDDRYRQEDEDG